jgi:DNA replication protein DnaC
MAEQFKRQTTDPTMTDLSFEERVGLMVDAEWSSRKSHRLARLIKTASYAVSSACVENITYNADRNLDKPLIASLSTCSYIQSGHNVLIMGATGAGKTYLSCALGMTASRNFYHVKYTRLTDLFSDLAVARETGSFTSALRRYCSVQLLIIDDWLLFPLKESEARDLFEIVNARCGCASTIIGSQFNTTEWHSRIGEIVVADAICDRLVNNAYTIVISGESMRKISGLTA